MKKEIKVISFIPRGLTVRYLTRIKKDLRLVGNTKIMFKVIEEYFLLKYGADERKAIRAQYIRDEFGDD